MLIKENNSNKICEDLQQDVMHAYADVLSQNQFDSEN